LGNWNYNTNKTSTVYENTSSAPLFSTQPPSKVKMPENDEIVVEVNGMMNITADSYVALFNLVQVGETMEDTDNIMQSRINAFKEKLNMLGIRENDVKSDLISFVPRYDIQTESKIFSKSYNEIPSGYEMQKNISVSFKEPALIDKILSSALQSEIYDIVKVDYFIDNLEQKRDSLRSKCFNEIKKKTAIYNTLGIKTDEMDKLVSDNFFTIYPQTRYASYQAFNRPSLNIARKKSINEVTKITSQYYRQHDSNEYDVIINPVITEPVIQLSYSVIVKYTSKTQSKNYHLITPSGEIKQLSLQ